MLRSAKDRAIFTNSLLSIVKSCEGRVTRVNLRNETIISGKIEVVYSDMNLIMSNATVFFLNGNTQKCREVTIRGNNIRFVEVPDSVDMINALRNQATKAGKFRKKLR